MPPLSLAAVPATDGQPLHRRETGRELPWARFGRGDAFETYEAPVLAPPGRFLWVRLELHGHRPVPPRGSARLRAEHPSHDLLRRHPEDVLARRARRVVPAPLPRALRRHCSASWRPRSDARAILLDPHAAPEEVLPWLASFLGLALDERWPLHARRELIAETPQLCRARGTVARAHAASSSCTSALRR